MFIPHDTHGKPIRFAILLIVVFAALFSFYGLKETRDKQQTRELEAKVKKIQKKLDSTPSGWPLRGAINSGYGYRYSPWRGMHTGIDIKASYGDPVRATAPGFVSYSGWMQGYGKTVEIDHKNGFKTLYGHNSVLAVNVGEKIEKEQIISYVGLTGFSTGAHLHYEVRKYESPINPVAFLNLSVLSAGKYF
ncbi:M23 family metallopeptidase [Candidatus Saganbacteria bacterium]|nr:M23 family metallopeptidase [Candidatus Saganbacteria bacterium]